MDKDDLWNLTLAKTEEAIASKSIKPFKTNLEKLIFNKYSYEFRSIIGKNIFKENRIGPSANPFKPWDKKLEILNIGDSHVIILNKFPVELGHMLLITKEWKPQNGWLDIEDWVAVSQVEGKIDGFWFFNNSENAGASQPHRHLQLLHRENVNNLFPTQKWYENSSNKIDSSSDILNKSNIIYNRTRFQKKDSSEELLELYSKMCIQMDIGYPNKNNNPAYSYNLLITNKWISLFRRSKEDYMGFSINALGFAGYFLRSDKSNMDWVLRNSPLNLLEAVVDPLNDNKTRP